MDDLRSFIPMDRRQALARNTVLPNRAEGAALLADLAGFTPLTETLAATRGPQRGAEELTRLLNRVYATLIALIDQYGGSVIGFSGDALTCWFDADDGARAVTCALALQRAMIPLATVTLPVQAAPVTLALKVAVAAGSVRRFLVGDPQVQVHDTLAGHLLDRLAAAEQQARAGEVVLDPATAAHLAPRLCTPIEREAAVVIGGLVPEAAPAPWPPLAADELPADQARSWVLPAVLARLQTGQGAFLAELRPAVALFVRFPSLDYDGDAGAGAQLDAYVRWVQQVLGAYEGVLVDLTMGDKGSYLYAAFGAPVAHAAAAACAAAAALELRSPPAAYAALTPVQIGLSQGVVWVGACGGPTRRTYVVLGDMVNLGARLMQHAAPGEILAGEAVRQAARGAFLWTPHPPVQVKGKAAPVTVHTLTGAQPHWDLGLLEPTYSGPLLGREEDLAWLDAQLARAAAGQGQSVGVAGEAGMGKSRLVVEGMRRARAAGWAVYGGAAQAYGTQTPYLAWQALWRSFFGLDSRLPLATQAHQAAAALDAIAPRLSERLPLLGPILGLPLPDTALTAAMEGVRRKASLESLLVDCLRARAAAGPLLLVLEDCHWLDPLSQDLLATLARAIAAAPVLLLLTYRLPDGEEGSASPPEIAGLAHFTERQLAPLAPAAAASLIAARLTGGGNGAAPLKLPPNLVEQITDRAEGNPFYLEELLHYLADTGIASADPMTWERLEWPASLHSLLLARIDHLTEPQRIVLKVASIIGRRFRLAELWGVYPDLGPPAAVQAALAVLDQVGLTPLDTLEPEPVYLFKHIVTQEVAYASQPYAVRARLHEQFAGWLEATTGEGAAAPVDLLAFHYGRSDNQGRQRVYYRRAGDAAAAAYAHATARHYYERLLPLLAEPEHPAVLLALGQVLGRQGFWEEAAARYTAALAQAADDNPALTGRIQTELGSLWHMQGAFPAAEACLEQACAVFTTTGDDEGLSRALAHLGTLYEVWNKYDLAHAKLNASRALCQAHADQPWAAAALPFVLQNLGKLAWNQGQGAVARPILEECAHLARVRGDKVTLGYALNMLGYVAMNAGDPAAQALWAESLAVLRETGERWGITGALNALGYQARAQGDTAAARTLYEESLIITRDIGSRWGVALALNNLGYISMAQGDLAQAGALLAESTELFDRLGDKRLGADSLVGLARVAAAQARPGVAARLLAAATRLLTESGGALDPLERAVYDHTHAEAAAALPPADFAAAWATGEGWTSEEAVAHAQADGSPAERSG